MRQNLTFDWKSCLCHAFYCFIGGFWISTNQNLWFNWN